MSFSGVYYLAEMKFQLSKVEISTPVENLHIFSPLKVIKLILFLQCIVFFSKSSKTLYFQRTKIDRKDHGQ